MPATASELLTSCAAREVEPLKKCLALALIVCLFVCPVSAQSVISRVPNDENKIALTFDDGPHGKYTGEILDILEEYGVKATFFVIGTNVKRYPELVERELCEGHEVENHTFDHVYLKRLSDEEMESQVSDNEAQIAAISDAKTHFIRPPGGIYDDRLLELAEKLDLKIALWSVDTHDWKCPTAQSVTDHVLKTVKSGDIILMHDYVCGKSPTPDALRIIIPALLERGFKFVTLSELAESDK